jgi:hypothetical protein
MSILGAADVGIGASAHFVAEKRYGKRYELS